MIKKTIDLVEKAMDSAQLAFWQIEFPSGRVVFSKRKPKMLGVKVKNEKTFQELKELVHSEDVDIVNQDLKEHLTGKKDNLISEFRVKSLGRTNLYGLE
jgi:hypothetical protein